MLYRGNRNRAGFAAILGLSLLAIAGCEERLPPPAPPEPAPAQTSARIPIDAPRRLDQSLPGLHNVVQVTSSLLSGSEPHGEEGFASLASLGIRTIISVDGARPAVDAARANGMRYVHIPIGYDGVPHAAAAVLARAVRECPDPIYVHCHHGTHRGPAAAAVACLASGSLDLAAATQLLTVAGTGKEYAGLWRDVSNFTPLPGDIPVPELVEIARVDSLATAMAALDRHWDNLKLCRDAGWTSPPEHSDLLPEHEALQIVEGFREATRTATPDRFDDQFRDWLSEAEKLAGQLEGEMRQKRHQSIGETLQQLEKACKQCHRRYRN